MTHLTKFGYVNMLLLSVIQNVVKTLTPFCKNFSDNGQGFLVDEGALSPEWIIRIFVD